MIRRKLVIKLLWHMCRVSKSFFICKLMYATDKVWITEMTMIHKIFRSVRNSHVQELTLILNIIGQCDIKHILTSPINTITQYIITSITVRPFGLAAILAIMSVLTCKTAVILCLLKTVIITDVHDRNSIKFVWIVKICSLKKVVMPQYKLIDTPWQVYSMMWCSVQLLTYMYIF